MKETSAKAWDAYLCLNKYFTTGVQTDVFKYEDYLCVMKNMEVVQLYLKLIMGTESIKEYKGNK